MDIGVVVRRHGGLVRRSVLRAEGVTRRALERSLQEGAVERLREGVHGTPDCDELVREAARHGGAVACVSALRARGVWILDESRTHVWVGAKGRAHLHEGCSCVTHRDAGVVRFGHVSISRALVQLAHCQTSEVFFAAFESAWHLGLLPRTDRRRVRERIDARLRWFVDAARGDAESGLESLLRIRLLRLGIALECQVQIPNVGRVDFVLDGRIVLEVDGRLGHDGPSMRHRDLRRDAAASAQGCETLRFDYAMVVFDWPRVEAAILGALARRPAHQPVAVRFVR